MHSPGSAFTAAATVSTHIADEACIVRHDATARGPRAAADCMVLPINRGFPGQDSIWHSNTRSVMRQPQRCCFAARCALFVVQPAGRPSSRTCTVISRRSKSQEWAAIICNAGQVPGMAPAGTSNHRSHACSRPFSCPLTAAMMLTLRSTESALPRSVHTGVRLPHLAVLAAQHRQTRSAV
jgi:hypothetical protein